MSYNRRSHLLLTLRFSLLFTICLSFFTRVATAQTNLDSLFNIWSDETQADSSRVKAYNTYIWYGYLFTQPDTAEVLAEALHKFADQQSYPEASGRGYSLQGIANAVQGNNPLALECYHSALDIYKQLGDKKGIATGLNNIGIAYQDQGNYPLALQHYQNALEINEQLEDKKSIAKCLNNIGLIYQNQGKYPSALEYFQKSLTINEELMSKHGIASTLGNIGRIYSAQGDYLRALEYYEHSLAIIEEIGDKRGMASILNDIGLIYDGQDNYPRALEYYQKSLVIAEELRNKQGIATCLHNIGVIYQNQENYNKALEHLQKSLAIMEELGDKRGFSSSLNSIGMLYQEQGKNSLARDYCQRSLALAEEIGSLTEQKYSCQCLYDSYKALGSGNEALVYIEKLREVEDSLHAEETTKKLEQMEFAKVMYADSLQQVEEKLKIEIAHQQEVAEKDKTRNLLMGGGLLFLLTAIGFFSRWRYVKKSRDVISKEKDRSENLLLNILPAEIAEELKSKGKADARDFEMVSILFTDFKGFTAASEKLSAQDLVSEINTCFEAFDGIMGKYDIEKIKTIGDAYMCAGGLPVPTDDSVKNTVLAALDMQAFISQRKKEMDSKDQPAFEMRVGVHTGPVVAGIVGVKKFQYDIWGDTVNTASRMESSGAVGKVNISQSTYELLKDDASFSFESRGKIEAKGKGKMEMWFVNKV